MTEIYVLAPLDGRVVNLEDVPDEVFAQKLAGDGLAIDPTGALAVAPVTGKLAKLFPGGHAFGLALDNDVELIVHIGLDTIELRGEGFQNIAAEGQIVQAGTTIVRFDRAAIVRRASGTVQAGRDILFVLEV